MTTILIYTLTATLLWLLLELRQRKKQIKALNQKCASQETAIASLTHLNKYWKGKIIELLTKK